MERSSSCFHPELPQRAAWGLGAGSWWVCGSFSWSLPELLPKRDVLPREGEESRTKPEPDPFPAPSCLLSCWLAGAHPAPSPCPGQPGSCGAQSAWWGLYPQRLTCFPCGCSWSLTGNTQFGGRRAPGRRVRSLADLSPDWEATVGSADGDREGQLSGTRHRPHAGQERPGRWPRGLTGPRLGQKQQGGGLGRVAGISAPTCIIKKKIQMNVSCSSL